MKKLILMLWLLGFSYAAYAACTTTTIMQGTKITTCTTCCDSFGNCTVNCF
jgi:hypothetical protein